MVRPLSWVLMTNGVLLARIPAFLLAAIFLATLSCQEKNGAAKSPGPPPSSPPPSETLVAEVIRSEDQIRELTPKLTRIVRSIRNMSLPDYQCLPLFAPQATANNLGAPSLASVATDLAVRDVDYPIVAGGSLSKGLWQALFDRSDYLADASLGVLRGEFPGGDRERFTMLLTFSGRARVPDGWDSLKGQIETGWVKAGPDWLIDTWTVKEFHASHAPRLFFTDVLDSVIPDPVQRARARFSIHEDLIEDMFLGKKTNIPYPNRIVKYFTAWDSNEQHPAVSVVDFDRDGWDDLYVMGRWGRNQLWHNRGDGTFEEIAPSLGLDIDGMCNSAIFADFDNDGDADCVLGRSVERSLYLRNDNGRFTDVSTTMVNVPLPFIVSSVSTIDYNHDGLLDLYFSTYYLPHSKVPVEQWAPELIEPRHMEEWTRRLKEDHPIFRRTGPPNLLLVNRGEGRFEEAPENPGLQVWLNTFHSTWSDFDADGDPDLFLSNDYGPDLIMRHDGIGADGKVTFHEVSRELAGEELQQFGMGVTLGDYDADGSADLYFTYMSSKAGARINAQFPNLTARTRDLALGNKLFRQSGRKFVKVSGSDPSALHVAKTGWSWGGQFGDFDNDRFIDLYVSSGYYTAPPAARTEIDL